MRTNENNGFGKCELFACVLLFTCNLPNGFTTMIMVFTQHTPQHHCNVSGDQGLSMNNTIPMVTTDGLKTYSSCRRYEVLNESEIYRQKGRNLTNEVDCDHGWTFLTNMTTIVTKWNLVCDQAYLKPIISSLYLGGILVGSAFCGILSDRFGRRPVFLWSTLTQFMSIFIISFSPNVEIYTGCMFILGCSSLMNYQAAVVLASEIAVPKYRATVNAAGNIGYAMGYMILPLMAYYLNDWRWLTRSVGIIGLLYTPMYWLFPESPEWLSRQGKENDSGNVYVKIFQPTKKDKIQMSEEQKTIIEATTIEAETKIDDAGNTRFTYLDLFKQRAVLHRTLVLLLAWFNTGAIYFGISLNTSNLGGDIYINCLLAAAVEIPAYILDVITSEKLGRTLSLFVPFFVGGVGYGIVPLFKQDHQTVALVLAMISKLVVTASFQEVYMYTCELYPTLLRHKAVGAGSVACRLGSILAPYLIFAGEQLHYSIPYVVLGTFSLLVACLCMTLPETKGRRIPGTMKDAMQLKRRKMFSICSG